MAAPTTGGFDLLLEFPFAARDYQARLWNYFTSGLARQSIDGLLRELAASRDVGNPGAGEPPGQAGQALTAEKMELWPFEAAVRIPPGIAPLLDPPRPPNPLFMRLGPLQMVVGVMVDHSGEDQDCLQVDFQDRLYYARLSVLNGPPLDVRQELKDLPALTLGSIPVERGSTEPMQVRQFDFKLALDQPPQAKIRDAKPNGRGARHAGRDALAGMFTFGGANPPRTTDAVKDYLSSSGTGSALLAFPWLSRIFLSSIAKELGIAVSGFRIEPRVCRLAYPTTIRLQGQPVRLDAFRFYLKEDRSLGIEAKLSRDFKPVGFSVCSFTARAGGNLLLTIQAGRLVASQHIDDPTIEFHLPWYGFLVSWLFDKEVKQVGSFCEALAYSLGLIAEQINRAIPAVNIPAVGVDIFFTEAYIAG